MSTFTTRDWDALNRIVGQALLTKGLAELLKKHDTRRGVLKTSLSSKAFACIDEQIGDVASLAEFSQSIYNLDQLASD